MKKTNLFFSFVLTGAFIGNIACTKNADKTADTAAPKPPVELDTPLEKWQEMIAKAPSYENFIGLGLAFDKANRTLEALEAYRKATEINPNAPVAFNNMCAAYNTLGKYIEALPLCEKAVALEPTFQLAKNNLLIAQGKVQELKPMLLTKKKEVLKTPGVGAQELINLGMDFYNVKEFESSAEVWSKVKKNDKLYATAQNNIASSYIQLKKFAEAEKAIQIALKLEPNNELFVGNKNWLERAKTGKQ